INPLCNSWIPQSRSLYNTQPPNYHHEILLCYPFHPPRRPLQLDRFGCAPPAPPPDSVCRGPRSRASYREQPRGTSCCGVGDIPKGFRARDPQREARLQDYQGLLGTDLHGRNLQV
ncbi:hypothetical protein FPV67DRAFT_1777439, partial [Lyophyllum atratum]